jgi:hypothetical protein
VGTAEEIEEATQVGRRGSRGRRSEERQHGSLEKLGAENQRRKTQRNGEGDDRKRRGEARTGREEEEQRAAQTRNRLANRDGRERKHTVES